MLIWSLSCAAIGQMSGMLAVTLRVEPVIAGLQAQLQEREETAAHLWHAYTGAHCRVKALELSVTQHLWPVNSWPAGDETGIHCASDPAGSPLFADQAGQASEPPAEERAAEAGRGGAAALVADRADAGR